VEKKLSLRFSHEKKVLFHYFESLKTNWILLKKKGAGKPIRKSAVFETKKKEKLIA
jgi:hypothetical protein